jgi:RNA polymerase sigma-70 factor (ECF subfamily)
MRRVAGRTSVGTGEAARARSDEELLAQLHVPNNDALSLLFRRYARLVYRVAVDILRDSGEAEDVTQEVFLEIYRKSHLYDATRGTVKVWLLQYAYHRTLRRKSTLKRRAAYAGEPLDRIDALAAGPRSRLTRQESRWLIRKGLAQLPERQRTTLELTCLEELTLRDVAERLRVSLGCARHYYYRGLARLRAWILQAGPRQSGQPSGPPRSSMAATTSARTPRRRAKGSPGAAGRSTQRASRLA